MSEYLRTVFDKFELRVRKGFYYTRYDLWLSIENGKAKVGVSDYLQKTSGDVAFIEVAEVGSTVERQGVRNYGKRKGDYGIALPHIRKS